MHNFARHWRKCLQFVLADRGKVSRLEPTKNCVPHVIRQFYFRSGLTTVQDWLSHLFSK